jgi:hypothetical protein
MIEDCFQGLIQRLFFSPAVSSFRIVKQHAQEEDGTLRIKCRLQKAHKLEFTDFTSECRRRAWFSGAPEGMEKSPGEVQKNSSRAASPAIR